MGRIPIIQTFRKNVHRNSMWCGDLEHPYFALPPTVHIDGLAVEKCCGEIDIVVLGFGELGGPSDEIHHWKIGVGDGWVSLDWSFPLTYGSRRTLKCLLRINSKKDSIQILLPSVISPDSSRPVASDSNVVILKLESIKDLPPPKLYKLGTSLQRAGAGTLKSINSCLGKCLPRCDNPWDNDENGGDILMLRVWHLRGEVSLEGDALWVMLRLRVEMHALYKGNMVLIGKCADRGWLKEMVEMEAEHYEETRLADAMEALMDRLHELGFSTVFLDSGQMEMDVTYENEPFTVYSHSSNGCDDISYIRRLRLDHFTRLQALIPHNVTCAEEDDDEIVVCDKEYHARFIKLAFLVRAARMRSTMSRPRRKHRKIPLEHIRSLRLEHKTMTDSSIDDSEVSQIDTPPCVPIPVPSKGFKQVGRRLGCGNNSDRTVVRAEQAKAKDVTVLRSLRIENVAHRSQSQVLIPLGVSGGEQKVSVWTESWMQECRMSRFGHAPRVHYTASSNKSHSESKPVGLVRKDMSPEELEMLMILREQSDQSRSSLWAGVDEVHNAAQDCEVNEVSDRDMERSKRMDYFRHQYR